VYSPTTGIRSTLASLREGLPKRAGNMASAVTIGLLAPLLFHKGGAHDFFSKFFASLRTTVQRHGLRLLVVQKPYDSHQCIPVSQSVDGWLVLADATGVEHLHQTGKPIVLVSACSPELGLPAVSVDNEAGMRAAVTHLIEHGHTRIAFVGHHAISESQQRYEAYAATLPGWGLALDPQLVISFEREAQVSRTGDLASMGRLACRQLLERQAPFTAVVCASDDLALGVLQGLQAAGLRVPEDVAVTGFDDSEAAQYARPALTSVHQDFAALAEASVARLLSAIKDRNQVLSLRLQKNPVSMATLTVRRSCGCDPAAHVATLFEGSDYGGPDWQDHLARQLVRLVQQAGPPEPDVSPGHVWPGAEALAGGIGAAVEGRQLPDAPAVEQAWQQALAFTDDLARLETILALLRKAGRQRLMCQSRMATDATGGAEARLEYFLCLAGLELLRAHRLAGRDDNAWTAYLQQAFAHAVQVLFAGDRHETDLGWLDETWARWGCLALWEPPDAGEPTPAMGAGLIVNSVYRWDGRTRPSLSDRFSQPDLVARLCSGWDGEPVPTPSSRYAASDFPPAEFIPGHPAEGGPPDVLLVLTIPNAWGVLLLRLPAEAASLSYGMLAPILAIALERARLVASLQEAAHEYIREKDAAEAARQVAEESNQLKTRLLANVSHELRTPLNIILGYCLVALAKPNPYGITLPAAFHDDLGHVRASGEHLLRLINDLLDVARAEMHELHLFPEEIAPRPFLENVFQSVAHGLGPKAGVTWRLHLPDHLPAIKADPVRLRQILFNLLSNALKFTKSGEIVLGAEAEPPHLHLWVADTGSGIPHDQQERIFEPFTTAVPPGRHADGIGLGLSITRWLVTLHGGHLSLESRPGQGSTFHVYLPLPVERIAAAPAGGAPIVLLVSALDQPAAAIAEMCSRLGLGIHRVAPESDLDGLLDELRPVALVWDLTQATAADQDVIERVRRHPRAGQLPFIPYTPPAEAGPAAGLTGEALAEMLSAVRLPDGNT